MKSSSLKVDEGSLTGESVTVGKLPGDEGRVDPNSPVQDQVGMLYSGTMVTSGNGVAVVVQTGMNTQFGKVRSSNIGMALELPRLTILLDPLWFAIDPKGRNRRQRRGSKDPPCN